MEKNRLLKMLVIDDDPAFLGLVATALAQQDLQILTASDSEAGWELFLRTRPHIVITDLLMPKLDGMQLLEKIIAVDPATEVILITGNYSMDSAVEAIRKGACDYLPKPLDMEKIRARIAGLIQDAARRRKTFELDQELIGVYQFEGIIGRSPLMLEMFSKIRRVAPHFRTVLVRGETGTGKELVARALHNLSPVHARPFVVCNCSAIVQTLLESELFGHVRGAFTGANQDKIGVFEYANGGTVFLDEIGELPIEAQAKLLRVLQNQEVQRVGSPAPRSVDVRVIAATNRDLRKMTDDGIFRKDLYYRLTMVELKLPTLAERKEDLTLLQRHFITKFAGEYKKPITGISRRAQICLGQHSWPGNVRELENVIGNACMMVEGNVIDLADLPELIKANPQQVAEAEIELISFDELERRHLVRVLEKVGGNKARAAEVLGVSRTTIYEMLSTLDSKTTSSKAKQAAASTS
ncbi:MAG TPA: sigma-54 dependent transcriptional regulator [Terriglobales bacterium]|nr:sigma-54 dependent transcriptional regulator [Terriglobales bacterium]